MKSSICFELLYTQKRPQGRFFFALLQGHFNRDYRENNCLNYMAKGSVTKLQTARLLANA